MNITNTTNKLNWKLFIAFTFSVVAVTVAGLVFGSQQASAQGADVNYCVWTGGGVGVKDTNSKTWTYNMSDEDNWNCGEFDGTDFDIYSWAAPPDGYQELEFPANLAIVDPDNTIDENEEPQWKYVVCNDLGDGFEIPGMYFTGDTGDDQINNDGYYFACDSVRLTGNMTLSYQANSQEPVIDLDIEINNDVTIEATIGGNSAVTVTDTSVLTLDGENSASFKGTLNNEGVVEVGRSTFTPQQGSTLGSVIVLAGGEISGCVEIDDGLTINGNYAVNLLNNVACTGYDQLQVTGPVDVTGGTLNLSFLPGYSFAVGDELVFITNDGSDEVIGQFSGLAEGDEIEINGNIFVLSYIGGDGNDITVTVSVLSSTTTNNPESSDNQLGAPNTGLATTSTAVFLASLIVSGVLLSVAYKQNVAKTK